MQTYSFTILQAVPINLQLKRNIARDRVSKMYSSKQENLIYGFVFRID